MSDNLERLRSRDEHLAQWAVSEIETLRQKVKWHEEREERARCLHCGGVVFELATLKQAQGMSDHDYSGWQKEWRRQEQGAPVAWRAKVYDTYTHGGFHYAFATHPSTYHDLEQEALCLCISAALKPGEVNG